MEENLNEKETLNEKKQAAKCGNIGFAVAMVRDYPKFKKWSNSHFVKNI